MTRFGAGGKSGLCDRIRGKRLTDQQIRHRQAPEAKHGPLEHVAAGGQIFESYHTL